MAKQHNRQQRKKPYLGEFPELAFAVSASLRVELDVEQYGALIDAFFAECIEANGMVFGGGFHDGVSGYIGWDKVCASATDEQREIVRAWLADRHELTGVTVALLSDAWHGHDWNLAGPNAAILRFVQVGGV